MIEANDLRDGIALEASGRWQDARSLYERSVDLERSHVYWLYRLGYVYEVLDAWESAYELHRVAIRRDPKGPVSADQAEAFLHGNTRRVLVRKVLANFVNSNLHRIHHIADTLCGHGPRIRTVTTDPIFWLWYQGLDAAPDIVKICHASIARVPGLRRRLVVLDRDSLERYVPEIREYFELMPDDLTHLSDISRLMLLNRYGGTWLDATVLLGSTDFLDPDRGNCSTPRYFRYNPSAVATWALRSARNGRLVALWLAAVIEYWRTESSLLDYYLVHHLYEALYWHDDEFRQLAGSADHWDARAAHLLAPRLGSSAIIDDDFPPGVHKLNRRFDSSECSTTSIYARLRRAAAHANPRSFV